MEKYKDTIYSRYFILREGLFKNTKKIINISRDYLMIENLDDKNYKEFIRYEDIVSIKISEGNPKDFKINYFLKDNDSRETSQAFTSNLRTQVVCDIMKQLDLHTKVNHYPVETFKCFLFLEDSDEIIKSFSLEGNNIVNKPNNSNVLDINLNIYRSIIEWVCYDSKRETRVRLSDIDQIKIYDINNNDVIFFKIETFNKIDLLFVAKNMEEYRSIVEKICDNAKTFIGVDIIVEHLDVKDYIKPINSPKLKIFSFNTYRILYNSSKRFVKLTGDYENLYENYENKDGIITKINKLPLNQIVYIICYENENEFFEIVLKSNARYLYQTLEQERNLIITSIIDLVSFNNPEEHNFILLSNKPKYGLKVMGFIYDEVDWEYDRNICLSLLSSEITDEIREKIVEDICLNFCFKSQKFRIDSIISNKKNISNFFQNIFDILKKQGENLKTLNLEENKSEYYRKVYVINLYLILYKSLISKYHYDTVLTDLYGIIINTNLQTIFFNSITIFRSMIPIKGKYLKKDEIAQKKWIVSFHLENGAKIKTLLYSKIFEKNLTYDNFENQNILSIYILLELIKNMYDFSKEINLLNEIIKEFNSYEFLYTLYMLLRCNSSIMIQISLEILIILLKNLTYEQEFSLKQIILKRSLIFLVLIKIFINDPNEIIGSLTLRFLKTFIISHVEATNLLLNLFPATLFYYIDKNKPNPINWQDDEWDAFFNNLTKDFNSTQLIWNDYCRKELLDFLENIIQNYENFSQNFNIIHSLKIGEIIDVSNMQYRESFNPNFYCLNYKELKLEYQTLKKYYFVWKYYLKRTILEKGRPILQINIDKPKKFWKKIMEEMITANSDWKLILLIKALTLLYKNHFSPIGPLKNLEFFVNIFSGKSYEIKSQLLQFFYVICEVEDNEIKTSNITNFVNIGGLQKLINFIPQLIKIEYLESSLEKINYNDIHLVDKISDNTLEEGKEKNFMSLNKEEGAYDKQQFVNYCNYSKLHNSFDQADNSIKLCAILVKLMKILDHAFSRLSETDNRKIMFPIPKIKSILMDENNFAKMFIILFCRDENLCSEFLELIIYNMNDPLTYQKAIYKTGLCDLLIIFLLKYKNPVILSFFEQISRYHNIIFNFDGLNNSLDEDEIEFTKVYSNANRFLMKYFPINILYIYFSNDYNELMKIIFTENVYCTSLIWNSGMLIALIECLNEKFKNFVRNKLKSYYSKIDFLKENTFNDFPVYEFDETFRFKYKELKNKVKSFIYYLDNYISKDLMDKKIVDKFENENPLNDKFCSFSNNIFDDHIEIVLKLLIKKIINLKEQLQDKSELYSEEMKIYFKSILKLIKSHDIELLNFTEHFKEIINIYYSNVNISESEEKIFRIIIKIAYVSIATIEIKSIENLTYYNSILNLLIKGVIFYLRKILKNEKETYLENLIKILSSVIQIINRNPLSVDNQDTQLIEILFNLIKEFLFKKYLSNCYDKKPLAEINSLSGQFFICILELMYLLSKIPLSNLLLIESGLILELISFTLFYDREKKIHSDFINIISKKSAIIINSLICFSNKNKDDNNVSLNTRQISKDLFDSITNLIGNQNILILTKINMNIIRNSLSTSFEYEKEISHFLISLKSTYELPDFIWDKKIRKEVKLYLKDLIEKTLQNNSSTNYIKELKEMKPKTYENEFVIDNIYIKLYNKDPHWKIKECDSFLEKIKQVFIKLNDSNHNLNNNIDLVNKNTEMIFAMSNCVIYSKANEKLLTNDKVFGERLNYILKTTTSKQLTYSIFHLLQNFSEKTNSMKFILHKSMFIVFSHILNKGCSNETLEQIIKILKNILKNDEFIEKLNLILMLYLLRDAVEKDPKEESIRIEIFKVFKKLYFNKIKSNIFLNLLKIYLPERIIKNLFNEKEINLCWIDNVYELPDLKWTEEDRASMKIKLQQSCHYFINNETYIEGFPQNLLDCKIEELSQMKFFQSQSTDELKIDNIYIRIFNKEPSYNINKNMIYFLKELTDSSLRFLKSYTINKFIKENSHEILNDENNNDISLIEIEKNELLSKKHFTICFTAVLLSIEQINFNGFNENLSIGIDKNKTIEEKSIDLNIIKKILSFHNILTDNYLNLFDITNRLLYLEIVYLLSYNKNGLTFISSIDFIKLLDKLVEDENKISDYEFIISLVLYLRLISFDMSSIECFLTKTFDKYVVLCNKRIILLKYLQLIIARIVKIDQYKILVTEKFSKDIDNYKNYSLTFDAQTRDFDSQYLNVWRKPPLNKENVCNIFKTLHTQNFYEEEIIMNNKITSIENKFPILPLTAISYVKMNEINNNIEKKLNLDKFTELKNHLKYFDDFLNIN